MLEDPAFLWAADALSLMETFARQLGVWERTREAMRERGADPERLATEVGWELETSGILQGHPLLEDRLGDADPEVRAMAGALLVRAWVRPGDLVLRLQAAFDMEAVPLAKACLAESVIIAARRADDAPLLADVTEWAIAQLTSPVPVVRFRVARALRKVSGMEVDERLDSVETSHDAATSSSWPAEHL